MDANKILGADLVDLIFDGRNKSYGAYELRTGYNKRLRNALLLTVAFALLILLLSFISSLDLGEKKGQVQIKEVQLEEIKQDEQPEPPPPPPLCSTATFASGSGTTTRAATEPSPRHQEQE